MKVDYVHKDTLTATNYVELNKNNELLISYNQALLKENQKLKDRDLIIAAELTKLQDENKTLKENAEHNDKVVDKINWENNLLKQQNKKYKEVIDKTIEYIEYNNEDLYVYNPDYDYEENIVSNYDATTFREDLLDILKEADKEVK